MDGGKGEEWIVARPGCGGRRGKRCGGGREARVWMAVRAEKRRAVRERKGCGEGRGIEGGEGREAAAREEERRRGKRCLGR